MKIEIVTDRDIYIAKIYDGPDGIDGAEFHCSSLGECFEEITKFRMMNSLCYTEDDNPTGAIRSYFSSIKTL
jgi:hypothetical protein